LLYHPLECYLLAFLYITYFPCVLGPKQGLISVMPAQAGIQGFRIILDSRFRGNDKPGPCEYLCNVQVNRAEEPPAYRTILRGGENLVRSVRY
jgi:hypothetical protein